MFRKILLRWGRGSRGRRHFGAGPGRQHHHGHVVRLRVHHDRHGSVRPGLRCWHEPSGVLAPSAPWTITLSKPATLTVTDVEVSGDQFTFFDNGVLLGTTSPPVPFAQFVGECISCALASSNFSHGFFTLPAGVNVITGVYDGGAGFGDGDFVVGVPEPASWALMLIGVSGLGVALRSRRKAAAALA